MFKYAIAKIQEKQTASNIKRARKVLVSCLKRWEYEDDRTQRFSSIFDDWFKQIPQSATSIILQLLLMYYYYPHKVVNRLLVELHKKLIEINTITHNNTIYIPIKSANGNSNSSNIYWTEYKLQNKLSKYIVIDDISELTMEQWNCISYVIMIDDCGGSGSTLTKYIERNKDILKDKHVYFITIHIMRSAWEYINEYSEKSGINISVISATIQEKAFNHVFFKNIRLRELFIKTSKDFGIPKEEVLGFKKSEGLFAFYNNTPNNTLGIFRYDTDTYMSPFPRSQDKKPDWWHLKTGKKLRELQNYNSIAQRR